MFCCSGLWEWTGARVLVKGRRLSSFSERWMIQRRRRNHNPIGFALGYCANHKLHSIAPPVFQHYFSVSPAETLKSFTELRLLFWVFLFCRHSKRRDPNLWPSRTHTVLDDCPLFSQLKLFYKPLKCVVRKRWRCKHVCREGSASMIPLHFECL